MDDGVDHRADEWNGDQGRAVGGVGGPGVRVAGLPARRTHLTRPPVTVASCEAIGRGHAISFQS